MNKRKAVSTLRYTHVNECIYVLYTASLSNSNGFRLLQSVGYRLSCMLCPESSRTVLTSRHLSPSELALGCVRYTLRLDPQAKPYI